ncbi:MAG: zinc ABC transporter substrate-binding protein [Clostridiales bacterium]|nr:zinc ABC transporter substrate-binding protein [Clostridiales bacterium]
MRRRESIRKRLLGVLAAWMLAVCILPGGAVADEPLQIVATVFPGFDFARQVAGEEAQVTMLIPAGSDSHSYEPSPRDLLMIQNADLFIYTGGESDDWIERILTSMGEDAPCTLRMMDVVTVLEEEHSANMEPVHNHDHAHHDHEHSDEMDEHVWTSPRNAMAIVEAVADKLSSLRPEAETVFWDNAVRYIGQISLVDQAFRQVVAEGQRTLVIFGDRFPLRYFAAEYGLCYDAAFPGCSEDSEPSVRTVISLVDTVRREQIPVVFYIEYSSQKTARILAEETGATTLLFHSCHTVSAQEIENGTTYVSLMWNNVDALKEALNGWL